MADFKIQPVRFAITTSGAGSTQDIVFPGFGLPKGVIIVATGAVNGSGGGTNQSIGFADGTTQLVHGGFSADAAGTSNTKRVQSNATIINFPKFDESGTSSSTAFFNGFITDGVQIQIGVAFPFAWNFAAYLIGGADCPNVSVQAVTLNASGVATTTDVGHAVSGLFATTIGSNVSGASIEGNHIFSFGVGLNDAGLPQRLMGSAARNGQATQQTNGMLSSTAVAVSINNDNVLWDAAVTGFGATDFELTGGNGDPTGRVVHTLAFEATNSPDFELITTQAPSAGNWSIPTSFEANYAMGVVSDVPTLNTVADSNDNHGVTIFGVSGTVLTTSGWCYKDNTISEAMVSKSFATNSDRLIQYNRTNTLVLDSTAWAFDADSLDFTMTTNPPSNEHSWVLAIGVGGGGGPVAPTVDAGGDYTGTVSTAIQLDATVTEGTGAPLTYKWEIDSGPGGGAFSDDAIEDPTFTPAATGTYQLQLTVTPNDTAIPESDTTQLNSNVAGGTITTDALKNNTGTLLASETAVIADVYNDTTGALVLHKTGLTTDASGILSFTDGALSVATTYKLVITLSGGALGLTKVLTT